MDKRLWNYSYLEYLRKAVEKTGPMCSKYRHSGECTLQLSACNNPKCRTQHYYWITLQTSQLDRDFYAGSLKEIKHLIHIDKKPNFGLKSARLEIYKISITFPSFSKWLEQNFRTVRIHAKVYHSVIITQIIKNIGHLIQIVLT